MEKLSDLLEMAKVSDIITKKENRLGISNYRSYCSSCRNRICGIQIPGTRLYG